MPFLSNYFELNNILTNHPPKVTVIFHEKRIGILSRLQKVISPQDFLIHKKVPESRLVSKLIAESLKMLPREIKLVVSYSDTQQNHVGTIYQATNWLYCGTTTGGKMLIDENGTIRHTKSINMVRLRHPEYKGVHSKTIMKDKGWEYVEGGVKHRYCMLRGSKKEKKELFSMVKDKVEDYPKLDIKYQYTNGLNPTFVGCCICYKVMIL